MDYYCRYATQRYTNMVKIILAPLEPKHASCVFLGSTLGARPLRSR